MGHEDKGRATLTLQGEDEIDDGATGGFVEIAGGFVSHEDRGIRCDGAGEREMAVLDRGKFGPGKAPVHEEADLFDILIAHLFAQRLPHRMGACLGHGGKDKAVTVRDDHEMRR